MLFCFKLLYPIIFFLKTCHIWSFLLFFVLHEYFANGRTTVKRQVIYTIYLYYISIAIYDMLRFIRFLWKSSTFIFLQDREKLWKAKKWNGGSEWDRGRFLQQDVPHQAITASTFITLRFNLTDKREKVGCQTFVLDYNIYTEAARRLFRILAKYMLH